MSSIILIVLPVFGLIFLGWLVRRMGVLGHHATSELTRFVVVLALPALLFDIVATARLEDIWQPGFIAVYGLGAMVMFGLTLLVSMRSGRHLADAAIDGLNSGYANTGFIGFPLGLAALGPAALAPTMIATIITACIVFAAAIILVELGLRTETGRGRVLLKVGGSLIRNPLLWAPAVAALFPLLGMSLPAPALSFVTLLGGAASPCALVALGLFLAAKQEGGTREIPAVTGLVIAKLFLHPLITWLLGVYLFALPPALLHAAVLIAALPTGTGSFMLAEFHRREAGITSKVILVSTLLSVLTVSGYLALIR